MRRFVLLPFVLLIALALPISAFHEFGQQIPSGDANGAFKAFLLASSCVGMNGEYLLASSDASTEGLFATPLQSAAQCRNEMRAAQAVAAYQSQTPLSPAARRTGALYCFGYAATGLNSCASSARSALDTVDEAIAQLKYAVGENYSGMAGGVVADAAEAQKSINEKNYSGSFASSFGRASSATTSAWQSLATVPSAPSFTYAVTALTSTQSLLAEEMLLTRKTVEATEQLERERATAEEGAEKLQAQAKTLLSEITEQKLYLANEGAAALALSSSASLLESGDAGTFSESIAKANWDKEEGDALLTLARTTGSAKKKGFLGDAVNALREAQARFSSSISLAQNAGQRAEELEQQLEAAVAERRTEVSSAIASRTVSAPEAAGRAAVLLAAAEKDLADAPSTRGGRIAFLTRGLARLNEILAIALEPQLAMRLREKVGAKIKSALQILEDAEKDGVDVAAERARLGSIEAALQGIPADEKGAAALAELEKGVGGVIDGVQAAALEKYSWLEEKWGFLDGVKGALPAAEQKKLASYAKYFGDGLDVEAALGNLKEIAKFVDGEEAAANAELPKLLSGVLAQNAVVSEESGTAEVDKPVDIGVSVLLRNPLGVPLEGRTEVELDELKPLADAAYVIVVNASEGVSLDGGKIILNGVRAGGEYFLQLRYAAVLARTTSLGETTDWADLDGARKTIEWGFECEKPVEVLLRKQVSGSVAGASASFGASAFFFTQQGLGLVGARVYCAPGANKVEISYSLSTPFAVARSARQFSGNESGVAIEYSLKSAADLEGARLRFVEELPNCEGPVRVEGGLRETHVLEGGILAVEFAGDWKAGEEKAATVFVGCTRPVGPVQVVAAFNGTAAPFAPFNSSAFDSVLKLEEDGNAQIIADATNTEVKGQLTDDLQKAVAAAQDSAKAFDAAFFVPEGMKHSKSLAEQQGALARKKVDKIAAEAEKVFAAPQKYATDYIGAKAKELEGARAEMDAAIAEVDGQAKAELRIADARQKEFGNADSQALLDAAHDAYSQGQFLAALLNARSLNAKLVGVPSAATAEAGAGGFASWALGVAGLAIIGLLLLFLSRGKQRELKEF